MGVVMAPASQAREVSGMSQTRLGVAEASAQVKVAISPPPPSLRFPPHVSLSVLAVWPQAGYLTSLSLLSCSAKQECSHPLLRVVTREAPYRSYQAPIQYLAHRGLRGGGFFVLFCFCLLYLPAMIPSLLRGPSTISKPQRPPGSHLPDSRSPPRGPTGDCRFSREIQTSFLVCLGDLVAKHPKL